VRNSLLVYLVQKNYRNRLIFAKVIARSLVARFLMDHSVVETDVNIKAPNSTYVYTALNIEML